MSDIDALKNVPEINFIGHMSLQETEALMREEFTRTFRAETGEEPELAAADVKTLVIKAVAMLQYQTMQYIDAKGRAELLKTSTGEYLDALAALMGVERKGATRATATVLFELAAAQDEPTAIPAGTRVKTVSGLYYNVVDYAEIPPGELTAEIMVQAEMPGSSSSGVEIGKISQLVDPIPYMKNVRNTSESTGGMDVESDEDLTMRVYLAPSQYSSAGPRDAYEYHVRACRSDIEDVQLRSPTPGVVEIYVVMEDGRLPNPTERATIEAYVNGEKIRPLCDQVHCLEAVEVPYELSLTYWIAESDRQSVGIIQAKVRKAVEAYKKWQRHLGRDINPTELIARVRQAGAKRVSLTAPADKKVDRMELPRLDSETLTYGGVEDD